jgi:hypothetical protein
MRKMILAVPAVAAAAALAISGAATATPSTKTEHFSLVDASTNHSAAFSAIATGGFTAGGTAIVDKGKATLQFPGGTITMKINRGHSDLVKINTNSACLQASSGTGTYTIAGGTGAYAGITGSGKATKHLAFVEKAVKGNCAADFAAVQAIVTLSGPVSLP